MLKKGMDRALTAVGKKGTVGAQAALLKVQLWTPCFSKKKEAGGGVGVRD